MKLLPILLLLALPATVQAQFTFTTNNDGSLNIASYTARRCCDHPGHDQWPAR